MTDPTPNGSRIRIHHPDGSVHDVTEDVGALYDLVVCSMDYGSDFLAIEDGRCLVRMIDLAGYAEPGYGIVQQARSQVAAAQLQGDGTDA